MRNLPSITPILALGAMVALETGCTTRTQVFQGYPDDQLWTAMVASAKSPSYDDWKVMDNEVYADERSRVIEVYRVLKRTYVAPESTVREEERAWKFSIALGHDAEALAPSVDFTARQLTVPAHVWREADRYFVQMRLLLGQPGSMAPTDSPASGAEQAGQPSGTPAGSPGEPAAEDLPE
jgi:hypothetical protein